jgi:hypothetical protein
MDVTPSVKGADGSALEGYGISAHGGGENGKLRFFTVDFITSDVPDSLILSCRVSDLGSGAAEAVPLPPAPVDDYGQAEFSEPPFIATLDFTLSFDPEYTARGEINTLNRIFDIDGQSLTLTTADIYPTHIRLNFADDPDNTAWLKSLSFYLENECGEKFEAIANGISATGVTDSPMMESHRLESSFFSKSRSLALYITGVTWLDRDFERIKIDLANKTAEKLPEGVLLERVSRRGDNIKLVFSAPSSEENSWHQIFGSSYYDETGNEFQINSWSSADGYTDENTDTYIQLSGRFSEWFTLLNYSGDTVYLSPVYSRSTTLASPVVAQIK